MATGAETASAIASPARERLGRRLPVNAGDRTWTALLVLLGALVLGIGALLIAVLGRLAQPALHATSLWAFVTGTDWDPVAESFGALPFIYGTIVTSVVAVAVAVPVALGLALFLTELAPARLRPWVSFGVELLSGIPSVVFGLWGLFVLVPWLRETVEPLLARFLGFLPLFKGAPIGLGYLAAGLLLAVMILPTIASVSTEVLKTTPVPLREAALALGATHWEMLRLSVLPHARSGLLGAVLLGLGRALGETMAVTMVIGNQPEIHASLFSPGYSLPSIIANEFAEATGAVHTGALAALALVPLISVLWLVISHGAAGLSWTFLTALPTPVGEPGGGVGNAVLGTLAIVALASAIGLPLGVGAGVFLAERGDQPFGKAVRFTAEVLSGVPSIVVGIVAYGLVVMPMKRFSAVAGALALAILMVPTLARSTEELVRLVPSTLREGALALGVPEWKTSLRVVLRTALGGIVTAALLAISRAAGETAPLLFTALNNQFWNVHPDQPTASLTVQIFNYAISPYDDWHQKAWSAALVLLLLVGGLNLTARALARGRLGVSP